jgi:hypothetical protein
MKKIVQSTLLTGFMMLVAFHQSFAQAEKAEAEIQQLMRTTPVVGLSVAVVKPMNLFLELHPSQNHSPPLQLCNWLQRSK